ncbi:hypothetical protein [Nocardia seriolae]|uniref:ABM domain-containing protein n=2 Tax=Nocardia seriolae TaxID=37332 RepID=A0ABC8AQG8_9NOCA|nr:hypothetical protein [Nocardia seriolae]APA96579.1 hypothetical protein NS506_02515 [Nocardia seriolae]MTJ61645.1 hypothetical protein [Nocardia seriolae]MTJ75168.1 hypothetical protein [Nocardia seriolae]MTJ86663.1 hypothetical protein [Nocardia seriolae]MTK30658.1 hypothetical protein [Nocardia seriolae]
MTYLVVDQRVEDVTRWQTAFSSATARRRGSGGELLMVLTDPTDPHRLLVIVHFDSPEAAVAWRHRPGVEREIASGGVIPDSVTIRILDRLPMPDGAIPPK